MRNAVLQAMAVWLHVPMRVCWLLEHVEEHEPRIFHLHVDVRML